MPDEPGAGLQEIPQGTPVASESGQANAATSGQAAVWNRAARKRLIIWFVVGFLVPAPFVFALDAWMRPDSSVISVQSALPVKAIAAFFVALATWVVARLEKRPLGDYGIPVREAFGKRFWEGFLWGFAMLSAILLILRLSGHFRIDTVALTGAAILWPALGWALVFLAVAGNEEFAFRGYLLFFMAKRLRFWRAAVFLSVVFAGAHVANHGENALGILQVFVIALLWCLTIRRTGNIWFALGFHAAWDWAETFFYGTANSGLVGEGRLLNTSAQGPGWLTGGSAGPEGSVVALAVVGICALLIHFRFPKVVYPDRPI